ncbi:unnamed protein product [Leptosia nina]|uniref:RETREG1-3/ARL6IP-like N-terminal reticulon-homology domain-containing protein n=1 Tax=Leptosia nina TaxID=320188 RepID=A0AAV1JTT5_9NEOP
MFSSVKKMFKWNLSKRSEGNFHTKSLLVVILNNAFEDILSWKKTWLTLTVVFYFHLVFLVCFSRQLNSIQIFCAIFIIILILDAFEAWLRYKHRTTCLKRLADQSNNSQFIVCKTQLWLNSQMVTFIQLRETNPTKAFLLLQMIFVTIFLTGRYISGYTLTYILFLVLISFNKIIPPITRIAKKLQQTADSEFELEGLVPDASTVNLDLLSIEPEIPQVFDDKQSLDCWKPEDIPIEDASDSSDTSSSLVKHLSMEKLQNLENNVEETDSSEDEYIPHSQQTEQFRSTIEVQPIGTWGNTAYNVISSFSGAVANMVYSSSEEKKRKRVSSIDSSDGFEMLDKNDFM